MTNMPIATFIPADTLRTEFSAALSEMYRTEVPLYGDLVELVAEVNKEVLDTEGPHAGEWRSAGEYSNALQHNRCACVFKWLRD